MKSEFRNDYAEDRVTPEGHGHIEFDWDAVFTNLGERQIDRAEQIERLAEAMHHIFEWCLGVDLTAKNSEAQIGRRLIAVAWVTNPKLFDKHPSLRKLSRALGISAYPLATLTGQFSRTFGITNKAQKHAWNRK